VSALKARLQPPATTALGLLQRRDASSGTAPITNLAAAGRLRGPQARKARSYPVPGHRVQPPATPTPNGNLPAPPTRIAGIFLALAVLLLAALALYLPADWSGDLRPAPDAVEYAVTAQRLASGESFALPLPGRDDPSRYPFGFPALLAPAYWFPGADLRTGLYGVIALGALGVLLVYLLGSRLWDRATGLLAALTLLFLPQYLTWNRAIMSETATATLVAATALLLWHATATPDTRRQRWLLCATGIAVGIAILVRLNNIVLLPALIAGLAAHHLATRRYPHPPSSGEGRSHSGGEGLITLIILAIGPTLAIAALASYSWITFGSPLGTGYRYWVPEWYADPRLTFAFTYAFRAPALSGDLNTPPDLPNIIYYARSLTGLLPAPTSNFLTRGLALIALTGALAALRDRRPAARAMIGFAGSLGVLAGLLFAGYFLADVRFLAPLAPMIALAIAGGARTGLRLIRVGVRARRPRQALPRAIIGVLIVAVATQALIVAAGPAVAACYPCQRLTGGTASTLYYPAPELATIAAYRDLTPRPSLLITDLLPPLLGAAGLTGGRTIVPLTLGEYWGKAPLRNTTPITDRQRLILAALRDGVPVYIDGYSINPVSSQGSGDMERFLQAHNARLEMAYSTDAVTIYRLVALP